MKRTEIFRGPLGTPDFLRPSAAGDEDSRQRTRTPLAPITITLAAALATGFTVGAVHFGKGATAAGNVAQLFPLSEVRIQAELLEFNRDPNMTRAWDDYLQGLNTIIPGVLARKVRRFWSSLNRVTEAAVPIPHAGPTEQDSFIFTWDCGDKYCEVEIFVEGHFEWFYCDRATDEYEGSEGNLGQAAKKSAEYLRRLSA